jgi:D-aminopeptidase
MFSHYAAAVSADRKRLRELGFRVGRFPTGERNALVDVPGVLVGHRTLDEDHTGVTAVLPHGGNLYADKVAAACHVVNGYGKAAGLSQLEELGTLESPLLLTNTLAVGAVWEGGLRHALDQNPDAARDRDTVNVVVAECFDGWLSDARSLPVRPEHALDAIAGASTDEIGVGNLGAGAGTTAFGFKAGVGMSSRRSESGHLLGCLVVPNFGSARDRHLLLGAEGAAAAGGPPDQGGSVVVVVGTDAPLSERQLRRLGVRAALGLGRVGSFATNGSGDYAFAFSTAHSIPHRTEEPWLELRLLRDDSPAMRELFEMAAEATHEAVLDSLCAAGPVEGRDGHRVEALPYELLARAPRVEPL